ncbi:hypothetical protein HK100_005373 [Physocladia obscura]|uniref:SART-1 protein n=1 Tax=Physocladia obscura TaxID=109957 RepID=A0AAD5SSL6_9FUNG|nr:hypothetical protein HK100_005373 [Physocladia obscura]
MFAKLEGKGLGAASNEDNDDNNDDDPLAWALRHKSATAENARKLAARKMKELQDLDAAATVEYSEKDLKGLRVAHSILDINDEILVLADKRIRGDAQRRNDNDDDDDEDELVSSAVVAKERLEKNLKNKSQKLKYNAFEDDEYAAKSAGGLAKRSLLSQYDDDDDDKAGFVIGEGGHVAVINNDDGANDKNGFPGGAISLEYEKMQEVKDYYTKEEAVTFMKPKKNKKTKKAKTRTRDEPDWPTAYLTNDSKETGAAGGMSSRMDEDDASNNTNGNDEAVQIRYKSYSRSNANSNVNDINFVDDDELQNALSRARNLVNQKIKRPNAEEILKAAQKIEDEQDVFVTASAVAISTTVDDSEEEEEDDLLVLSATSEFVNNLPTAPAQSSTSSRRAVGRVRTRDKSSDDEDNDAVLKATRNVQGEGERGSSMFDNDDNQMDEGRGGNLVDASMDAIEENNSDDELAGGIEEEPLISEGLAATLKLLGKQGLIQKVDDDLLDREKKQKEHAKWLSEQRIQDRKAEIIKEREKARQREINKAKGPAKRGGGGHHVDKEDEWRAEEESRIAERHRLREIEDRFKNYTPDVNIKYNDEYGRDLSPKEAFRLLSHKFHGKGSGKMKTEKRLLKMDEEVKLQKMQSSDTPLGTANALLAKTKANKTAHLVLSVGNRGSLPSELIAKEEKALLEKMQKKATASALAKSNMKAKVGAGGKIGSGGGSGGSGGGGGGLSSGTGSVSSKVATGEPRQKVAFGLGVKRKTESNAFEDESAAKRAKD